MNDSTLTTATIQHDASECPVPESPSHSCLIEVIHDDEDRIDIEEEDRIYRAFDLVRLFFVLYMRKILEAHSNVRI